MGASYWERTGRAVGGSGSAAGQRLARAHKQHLQISRRRLLLLGASMLALTGFVTLLGLALRASPSLGAPQSRPCATVNPKAPNEVAAEASLSYGQVLACETQQAKCPRGVWGCVASLRGEVIARKVEDIFISPDQIAREIEGQFIIAGVSDGKIISPPPGDCTGTGDPPNCRGEAEAVFPPGAGSIEGLCHILALRLTDYRALDSPTPVYIHYCDLKVTALKYAKDCSPPPFHIRRSGESTIGRASAVATGKTSCRAPKRIPVSLEPNHRCRLRSGSRRRPLTHRRLSCRLLTAPRTTSRADRARGAFASRSV
jgi:hypothetical protein